MADNYFRTMRQGEVVSAPLTLSSTPITPALAIRRQGGVWYNPLVSPDAENALPVHIHHNGTVYALSREISEEYAEETVAYYYTNAAKYIVLGTEEPDVTYDLGDPSAPDWYWNFSGIDDAQELMLPPAFVDPETLSPKMSYASYGTVQTHEFKVVGMATLKTLSNEPMRGIIGGLGSHPVIELRDGCCYIDGEPARPTTRDDISFDYAFGGGDHVNTRAGFENCDKAWSGNVFDRNPEVGGRDTSDAVLAELKANITETTTLPNNSFPDVWAKGSGNLYNLYSDVNGRILVFYSIKETRHTLTIPADYYRNTLTTVVDSGGNSWLEDTDGEHVYIDDLAFRFLSIDDGTVIVYLPSSKVAFSNTVFFSEGIGNRDTNLQITGRNGAQLIANTDYSWTRGYFEHNVSTNEHEGADSDNGYLTLTASGISKATNGLVVSWSEFSITDFNESYNPATANFKYYNAGTATGLLNGGTTVSVPFEYDVTDETTFADPDIQMRGTGIFQVVKTKTGTAFYQTQRAKCFDIPAMPEIWVKFDVYFDGTNRWRAYNGGTNGTTGVTAQTTGQLSLFSNDTFLQNTSNVCKAKRLQEVFLHMVTGTTNGLIECWVDGNLIYSYTGDVNHGEDFSDFYLQSDGAGTLFSDVSIVRDLLAFSTVEYTSWW